MTTSACCATSSILCFRCENKKLKQQNEALKLEVQTLKQSLLKYEIVPEDRITMEEHQRICKYVNQSKTPFTHKQIEYCLPRSATENDNMNMYTNYLKRFQFMTLTFDPAKWGILPLEEYRKNSILLCLVNLFRKKQIGTFYGSFEYHKNGIIHAHILIWVIDFEETKKQIRALLTNNKDNRRCLDYGPAKFPRCLEYITKESTHYFKLKCITGPPPAVNRDSDDSEIDEQKFELDELNEYLYQKKLATYVKYGSQGDPPLRYPDI